MKGHFRLTVHVDEAEKYKSTTGKKVKNAKGKFENATKVDKDHLEKNQHDH